MTIKMGPRNIPWIQCAVSGLTNCMVKWRLCQSQILVCISAEGLQISVSAHLWAAVLQRYWTCTQIHCCTAPHTNGSTQQYFFPCNKRMQHDKSIKFHVTTWEKYNLTSKQFVNCKAKWDLLLTPEDWCLWKRSVSQHEQIQLHLWILFQWNELSLHPREWRNGFHFVPSF